MRFDSLDDFIRHGADALAKGPVAMIFVEDLVEVEATIRHHLKLRFRNGPVDVKDSVFTLKNPGTDEGFRGACQAQ
ncbi:Metallo-beta-lactamase family protein [Candidatus Rhodobacter oscarellae]|uniref:Metallo-beta-lactamase family protein n=1 Tax=Candidatus Rhodobacter oscarellae TaxID=1675527 RepID=A0A0J9EAI0_9RHOB|nr:hypothetical protein [Candidatus Rhodobacter lobularis]KMW59611.1 Metallo-beta-lactamase family protein [Candidatus Rhodobacter lobularis]